MGKNREKLCKPKDFKVGERYYWSDKDSHFLIIKKEDNGVVIFLNDRKAEGFIYFKDTFMEATHWPLSSLEKELM